MDYCDLCDLCGFRNASVQKDGEGAATIFGYQLRFVETGSMEKSEYTDVSGYKIKAYRPLVRVRSGRAQGRGEESRVVRGS
ncbi:MAG: hypothetical protein ACLUSP_06365 [Christensenellales bacterium]